MLQLAIAIHGSVLLNFSPVKVMHNHLKRDNLVYVLMSQPGLLGWDANKNLFKRPL
jgi:hypothetical protein